MFARFSIVTAACLALLCPLPGSAKIFRNAYVQFDLPGNWNCTMEGTEWVCASTNKSDSKESIIVLAAKEVGPQDSFVNYQNYLKAPKKLATATGKAAVSQVKNVRLRKINDQQWVDSLHLGSEIPGYYTRYVATVKDKLAILITLSAHQKHYTKYSNDFFRTVESLRVVASKDLMRPNLLAPVKPGSESIGVGINTSMPPPAEDMGQALPEESDGMPAPMAMGGGALLLTALGWFLWKKSQG